MIIGRYPTEQALNDARDEIAIVQGRPAGNYMGIWGIPLNDGQYAIKLATGIEAARPVIPTELIILEGSDAEELAWITANVADLG
jgi:hypothetical protein